MRARLSALVIALCCLSSVVGAVEMYRWVDDRGHTNVSDVVPERYRGSAQKIDSGKFELSEAQRKDAAARAAAQARMASSVVASVSREASSPLASPSASSPANVGRSAPVAVGAAGNDCAALSRQYLAALACFSPCVQGNGSIKVECYARCPNVVDPSPRCGLPNLR